MGATQTASEECKHSKHRKHSTQSAAQRTTSYWLSTDTRLSRSGPWYTHTAGRECHEVKFQYKFEQL